MIQQIILIIIPLVTCGDEVSDILYIIQNWNTFANTYLQVFSLLFLITPFILMMLYLQIQIKSNRYCILIDTLLVWTKLQFALCPSHHVTVDDVIRAGGSAPEQQYLQQSIRKSKITTSKLYAQQILETFLEDIPQIFIQTINNNLTDSWNNLQNVSIVLSSTMILVHLLLLFYSCCTGHSFFQPQKHRQLAKAEQANIRMRKVLAENQKRLRAYEQALEKSRTEFKP